jgi:hypothetical protein
MTTSPTSSLVEAIATAIGGYMASADRAHGYHIEAARAALSAIEQQGFAVMPAALTDEMKQKGEEAAEAWCAIENIYESLLSARPKVT